MATQARLQEFMETCSLLINYLHGLPIILLMLLCIFHCHAISLAGPDIEILLPKVTRDINRGQLLKQVSMANGIKSLAYVQTDGVQLVAKDERIRQEQQQLLCCGSILHESKLSWANLAGNVSD